MSDLLLEIVMPAFVAGMIVLATHVPFGREVLRRGIIFIDLAIAQIAGLGVIAASVFLDAQHSWVVQSTAAVAAVSGALLFSWIERHWPDIQEALIGASFILAATASLLLLANDPHAGDNLKELLVGQILWVDWQQLLVPALLSAIVLTIWFLFRASEVSELFYVLFAVSITMSVQLVGIYLVFASLIIPALAANIRTVQYPLLTAYLTGGIGFAIGLVVSSLMDLPSGPVIVWSLAGCWLMVLVASRFRHET